MSARSFARLAYRLLLRLHPPAFRQRFSDEMLWIFDLSSRQDQTAYMLYDGARSIVIQHAKVDLQEQPAPAFGLEVQTSGLTVARLGQATVLAAVALFGLASLIAREMPSAWYLDHDLTPMCGQSDVPAPKKVLEIKR
jgi:hypothetical protein